MDILFFQEEVNFIWRREDIIGQWIRHTFDQELDGTIPGEICIIFCSDNYLLDINTSYLEHDYYTDIITFPYSDSPLTADLYISIDRVKDNANRMNHDFYEELYRVIIHGILHLCGYKDKSAAEKKLMRAKEDRYLKDLLPVRK